MCDRHTFRATWHTYNGGIFFVTICAADRQHIFGEISQGNIHYTPLGNIVNDCLSAIPEHHADVALLNHVVMPNHIHMVLSLSTDQSADMQHLAHAATATGCLKPPRHIAPVSENHFNSRLAIIVRSFKAACTIEINRQRQAATNNADSTRAQSIAPLQVWQRNYHEHIIRNRRDYEKIMNYVSSNIEKWDQDCFNSPAQ